MSIARGIENYWRDANIYLEGLGVYTGRAENIYLEGCKYLLGRALSIYWEH